MQTAPIVFDNWESVLETTVPTERQEHYREAIAKFRRWLRETGKAPVADTFKEHLEEEKSCLHPEQFEMRRDALRWYYKEGLQRMKSEGEAIPKLLPANRPSRHEDRMEGRMEGEYRIYEMNDVPTAGARDLGGPAWEQALVARIRERHLAWTSEKTYRAWCRRFMGFCGGKLIDQLGHGDVRKWLSDLAVKERVSVATQSQALNAAVFFFREVLRRDPGDFSDFIRARRGRKVPSYYQLTAIPGCGLIFTDLNAMKTNPILLHACCGPCSTHCTKELRRVGCEPVVFFSNSNIMPSEEYALRLESAKKFAADVGAEFVEDPPDNAAWLEAVKGFENEPEGGKRCEACFRFNLGRVAKYAAANGFERFTTSLTVSPRKRSAMVFEAGDAAAKRFAETTEFVHYDFKKNNGFLDSVRLSEKHGLYRQNYCGCVFSKRNRTKNTER